MEPIIDKELSPVASNRGGLLRFMLIYGVCVAIVYVIITLIFYFAGSLNSKLYTFLGYIYWIAAVVFIQLSYRKLLGGYMRYGQGVAAALAVMFCASIIVGIFTFVLNKYINPDAISNSMLIAEEQLYERGFSDDDISMAMKYTSKFMTPGIMAVTSTLVNTIMGLIIGVITAIFTQKEKPIFE